jgi:hypothetical protein
MAKIRVYKRNSTFVELSNLVEELSNIGLTESLRKYYNTPLEHEAKNIIAPGDILQFESDNHNKYFMFSLTGTWDEIIKLQ